MTSENRGKKTRRPNGTGSEWKDAKGVWHARKQTDPDPRTGRRRWIEAQAPTKTAARQKLEAKIDQRRRQGTLPLVDTPTVDLYLDRWLHQTANRVKPRVLDTYRSECNAIRSVIGGMRLDRITPETIEAMCDELATTRSGKTVHNIYIRTKQILNHAVRDKLIPINPALAAIPPRYEPADTIILQPGQPAAAIHAAARPQAAQTGHAPRRPERPRHVGPDVRPCLRHRHAPSRTLRHHPKRTRHPRRHPRHRGPLAAPTAQTRRHHTRMAPSPPHHRQLLAHPTQNQTRHTIHPPRHPNMAQPPRTRQQTPMRTRRPHLHPATANHSPATSNDDAGNAHSRTPDSHPSPCEPHATSSAPTSPKPAPQKTPAKPSWAMPKSPPQPDTPTGHQKPSQRSPTRPGKRSVSAASNKRVRKLPTFAKTADAGERFAVSGYPHGCAHSYTGATR